ncbi:MAG: hypothetical protein HY301_10930 [Verrucomicrobia bacterium]|nr:hypothetical protein [Verrucomicrobiota bacterium]
MSQESTDSLKSPCLPIALLALALIMFFGWQIRNVMGQKESLNAVAKSREAAVKESKTVQDKLQAVATALIKLADTDPDAKAIVQFYGIQQTAPAGAAAPKK